MSVTGTLGDGLRELAERLPNIIQDKLGPMVNHVQWPIVLKEVDRMKGRVRTYDGAYDASDLQVQLRILTEPLASMGYPLDDRSRTVSILAGQLRSVRNNWAHTDVFTALQAFRALDSMVRLLEHFGDEAGCIRLAELRNNVIPDLLEELGVGSHQSESKPSSGASPEVVPTDPAQETDSDRRVHHAAERSTHVSQFESHIEALGRTRVPFEPWTIVQMGPPEVFDNLRLGNHSELVRATAEEIIDMEGPIASDRLARLVLRSFNRHRASPKLKEQIHRQVKRANIERDSEGFYWPKDLNRDTWAEFRPSPRSPLRDFEEISVVELRNTARHVQSHATEYLSVDEIQRAVLAVFGFRRKTKRFAKRLELAVQDL